MDVFDLTATIRLEVDDYLSSLNTAERKTAGFSKSSRNIFSSFAKAGAAAFGAAEAAVGLFVKSSISAGKDFDQSMSQVAATMGKSVDEMTKEVGHASTSFGEFEGNLRQFAQFMGQNTAFSATEAADALNYMALAGYTTQESMDMLPNVLSLAAAGAMDLATASDMVTDTQTAFGISAERTTQMVDEMAKAASTGNTSVSQLGNAFLVVGGLAQDLNGGMVTLENGTTQAVDGVQELEIALTAMANAGVKGGEAGTHMRNMLLKLSDPADGAQKLFKELGINIFDTEGKMRSLKDVFSDLNAGLSTLTQEEKLKAISDIFNARDVASAEALLKAVGEDWDKIGESILDAEGAASKMAAVQLDNLEGDITLFRSALEGAQIAISDNLKEPMREFVQFGTQGISELTSAFQSGGLDAAMSKFGELLSEGLAMVVEGLPGAVNAGAKLLAALGEGIVNNLPQLASAASQVAMILGQAILDGIPWVINKLADLIPQAMSGIIDFGGAIVDLIDSAIPAALESFGNLITAVLNELPNMIKNISKLLPKIIKALSNVVKAIVGQLPTILNALIESLPEVIDIIGNALVDNVDILIDAIADVITMIAEQLPTILNVIIRALPAFIMKIVQVLPRLFITIVNAITRNLPKIINAIVKMLPQIIVAISQIFVGIVKELPKLIMSIVEALIESGPEILDGFMKSLGSLVTAIPKIAGELWNAAKGIGAAIINGINDFFKDPIGNLKIAADWISGQIFGEGTSFEDVKNAFSDWWNAEGPGAISKEQWSDILGGLDLMLTDAGNYLLKEVFGADTSVEEIKGAFSDWWNSGIGALSDASWEDILGGLKIAFFDDNEDWFMDLVFGASGAPGQISAAIGEAISDGLLASEEPMNELQEKLNAAGIGWNDFWSDVAGTFGAENAIGLIGGGVVQFDAGSWIDGSIFNNIGDRFTTFGENWNAGWEAAFQAIVTAYEDWQGAISGIWELIKQSFPVGEAYDWGVELVESFFEGIMNTLAGFTGSAGLTGLGVGKNIADLVGGGESSDHRITGPNNPTNVVTGPIQGSGTPQGGGHSGGSNRMSDYGFGNGYSTRFSAPESVTSAGRSRTSMSDDSLAMNRMVELLEDIAEKDMSVSLEGNAAGVFDLVNKENRRRTRATRYNALSMVRS